MKTKILLLIMALTFLTSCNFLREVGGGISGATEGAGKGALCVFVGKLPCIIGGAVVGYADGKEARRDEITGENKELRSERIVDEVLTKKGFDVKKKCGFLGYKCW